MTCVLAWMQRMDAQNESESESDSDSVASMSIMVDEFLLLLPFVAAR